MLLPIEVNSISQKEGCERNLVRAFGSGGGDVIFTLLTKVVTVHVIFSGVYFWEPSLKKVFLGTFQKCDKYQL